MFVVKFSYRAVISHSNRNLCKEKQLTLPYKILKTHFIQYKDKKIYLYMILSSIAYLF